MDARTLHAILHQFMLRVFSATPRFYDAMNEAMVEVTTPDGGVVGVMDIDAWEEELVPQMAQYRLQIQRG